MRYYRRYGNANVTKNIKKSFSTGGVFGESCQEDTPKRLGTADYRIDDDASTSEVYDNE